MVRLIYFAGMLLLFSNAFSQSNTDEMLGAPKAHYYIQLWPDFSSNAFEYTLDFDGPSSKTKPLKNLTVGIPMKSKAVALTIRFYNPLRYSVKTSDTLLVDPSYQSIGEFAMTLTNLLGTLPNAAPLPNVPGASGAATSATDNASTTANVQDALTVFPAGKFELTTAQATNNKNVLASLTISGKESSSWVKKINSLRDEELAEWKFISLQGNVKCIDTTSKVLKDLKLLDDRYFNASIRGVMKEYLIKLSQPDNMADFQEVNRGFKTVLDNLDKVNQNNIKSLQAFNELISDDISKDLLRKSITGTDESACKSFATYSQIVFKRFARARAEFQEKRNQMLDLGKKINKEVDDLMIKAVRPPGGSKELENAFVLKKYDIQIEKMRDIQIVIQERKLNLNASPPSIDKTGKQFVGKVRLRAAQTFVPEFSIGGFYTNLTFPTYYVKLLNDRSAIGKKDEDYPVGAAGMLNLTLNAIDGLAHPLIQLGVGTGKNRPTLLAGAGLRLSWKMPIVITGGAIWHWRQQLINDLNEDDDIVDETKLAQNIDYRFVPKPKFYLGVQIGIAGNK